MSIESTMVSYYAERAAEYERIYHKPERQADLRHLRSFVERTFADADVFELACGTGYWTEILSRTAASVVAADINEEVLEIARSKPIDIRKTTFRIADAYHLPDFAHSFTSGLSVFWWSHVPKARLRDFFAASTAFLRPAHGSYSSRIVTSREAAHPSRARMSTETHISYDGWMRQHTRGSQEFPDRVGVARRYGGFSIRCAG